MSLEAGLDVGALLGSCHHHYLFDRELQGWVCCECGKSLGLVSSWANHRCEPDCEIHQEVSGLG